MPSVTMAHTDPESDQGRGPMQRNPQASVGS